MGFTGPPMTFRLAAPPMEFCARAGAHARRLIVTSTIAPLLMALWELPGTHRSIRWRAGNTGCVPLVIAVGDERRRDATPVVP